MNMKKVAKLARELGQPVPVPSLVRKATPAGAAMAGALLSTRIVPDCGDPVNRQLAQNAGVTLIKASREAGPIRDPRLTMLAGR
jgi:hypothetical protein